MTTTDQRHVRDVEQQPAAADQAEDAYIHYDHIGHGSTPAAWTLSLTIVLGSVIAGVGFIIPNWTVAAVGGALVPVGIILGIVLKKMGYGVEMDSKDVLQRGEDPRAHRGPATPDNTRGGEQKRRPGSSSA